MGNPHPHPSPSLPGHLLAGEEVLLLLHPSRWGYAWHFLLGVLLLAAGAFIPLVEGRIIAVLAGVFYAGYTEMRRRRTTYFVTTRRVIGERRVISRRISTVAYSHITDLHLAQSFRGRLTGTGTISINTAGKDGFEMVMEHIPRAEQVRSTIDSRMIEHQSGRD